MARQLFPKALSLRQTELKGAGNDMYLALPPIDSVSGWKDMPQLAADDLGTASDGTEYSASEEMTDDEPDQDLLQVPDMPALRRVASGTRRAAGPPCSQLSTVCMRSPGSTGFSSSW